MTISHILKKSYLFTGVARPQILTFWDSHYIMGQNLETQKNKGVSGYQYVPEFRLLSLLLVVFLFWVLFLFTRYFQFF